MTLLHYKLSMNQQLPGVTEVFTLLNRRWKRLIFSVILPLTMLVLLCFILGSSDNDQSSNDALHFEPKRHQQQNSRKSARIRRNISKNPQSTHNGENYSNIDSVPILVILKSRNMDIVKRSVFSLRERIKHSSNVKIYIAPIYYNDMLDQKFITHIETFIRHKDYESFQIINMAGTSNNLNSFRNRGKDFANNIWQNLKSVSHISNYIQFLQQEREETANNLFNDRNSKFNTFEDEFSDCDNLGKKSKSNKNSFQYFDSDNNLLNHDNSNVRKTTIKFLNRHVNTSKLVTFQPKLSDRHDSHDYFMAFHNDIFNPQYQMCFGNSYKNYNRQNISEHDNFQVKNENYKPDNLNLKSKNFEQENLKYESFQQYLSNKAKVEIIYPMKATKLSSFLYQNEGKIDNVYEESIALQNGKSYFQNDVDIEERNRKNECLILKRFKQSLQFVLKMHPEAQEFILVGDENLYSTDFVSFFGQTREIFHLDPSVYCVSLGSPLYPGNLPDFVFKSRRRNEFDPPNLSPSKAHNVNSDMPNLLKAKRDALQTGRPKISAGNIVNFSPKSANDGTSTNESQISKGSKISYADSNHPVKDGNDTYFLTENLTKQYKAQQDKIKKGKEIPKSVYQTILTQSALRRTDHFLFKGATMVTRAVIEQIINDFILPKYPSTVSKSRPKDFQKFEAPTTNCKDKLKLTSRKISAYSEEDPNNEFNSVKPTELHNFDIMYWVSEWLSWYENRRLRGCIYPQLPRIYPVNILSLSTENDGEKDKTTFVSWESIYSTIIKLKYINVNHIRKSNISSTERKKSFKIEKVKRHPREIFHYQNSIRSSQYNRGNKCRNNELDDNNQGVNEIFDKKVDQTYQKPLRIDEENCIRPGITEIKLMDMNKMVRHRYYKEIFNDMFHSEYFGMISGSNCTSRDFYPLKYKLGSSYVLHIKMISHSDDYTLRKVLQCFGVVPTEGGLVSHSSAAGQFDGVYTVVTRDGSVVYIMAIPLARLTPEIPSMQVVTARPGTNVGVVITPYTEFWDSQYKWKPIEVVSTDDFVSPNNKTVTDAINHRNMQIEEQINNGEAVDYDADDDEIENEEFSIY